MIGGAIGAAAGNLWSKRMEDKRAEMNRATQGTGIQVARTRDNQLEVAVPSDFSFDSGSSAIKPQMRPVLDQFAQGLSPDQRVTIPATMPGPMRRTSVQSTPPSRWCARTLALDVNISDAMPVPSARCTVCSGANCCALNIAASTGTSVMPPPMPSRPARKPTEAPAAR